MSDATAATVAIPAERVFVLAVFGCSLPAEMRFEIHARECACDFSDADARRSVMYTVTGTDVHAAIDAEIAWMADNEVGGLKSEQFKQMECVR